MWGKMGLAGLARDWLGSDREMTQQREMPPGRPLPPALLGSTKTSASLQWTHSHRLLAVQSHEAWPSQLGVHPSALLRETRPLKARPAGLSQPP